MFITLNVQYTALKQQYRLCADEQDSVARELENVTQRICDIEEAAGSNGSSDSSSYKNTSLYRSLQAYSTKIENKKDFLATKMELLKGEIDSFEKARIEETSIWCWA